MLSAIVLACDAAQPHPAEPEAVVASLAALVPAVIDGLIREASLAVTGGDTMMREIADHAGCELIETKSAADVLPAALAAARGPRVLVLRAGCVPAPGFAEELVDFFRSDPNDCAVLRPKPQSALARIFPRFVPVAGLIGAQSAMRAAGRNSLAELARTMRLSRVLPCRALDVRRG